MLQCIGFFRYVDHSNVLSWSQNEIFSWTGKTFPSNKNFSSVPLSIPGEQELAVDNREQETQQTYGRTSGKYQQPCYPSYNLKTVIQNHIDDMIGGLNIDRAA